MRLGWARQTPSKEREGGSRVEGRDGEGRWRRGNLNAACRKMYTIRGHSMHCVLSDINSRLYICMYIYMNIR